MTTIKTLCSEMKPLLARHGAELAAARDRRPVLAPYASPYAILDALRNTSALDAKERAAVVAALIREQQRKAHPLWQSILVVAFEPMLNAIRARISRREKKSEASDRDQLVFLSFLEAVNKLPEGEAFTYAPIALRWATGRAVYSAINASNEAPRFVAFDEELDDDAPHDDSLGPKPPPKASNIPIAYADASEAIDVARFVANAGETDEIMRVVFATCTGDESLERYVARVHAAETDAARATIACRLKRERRFALYRLRARFERVFKAA